MVVATSEAGTGGAGAVVEAPLIGAVEAGAHDGDVGGAGAAG